MKKLFLPPLISPRKMEGGKKKRGMIKRDNYANIRAVLIGGQRYVTILPPI